MKLRKASLYLILFILLPLFSIPILSQSADSSSTEQAELEEILEKCAEYCHRLANSALDFVCIEKIKEEIFFSPQTYVSHVGTLYSTAGRPSRKNVYVYDYQLIRKKLQIKESRILLKENGKKKNEKDAELKTHLFGHQHIVFGPVGLLSEFWQQYYDYRIVKREKFKGDRVIVIEAIPIPHLQTDNLYGKIWVREGDFSIMKIEWEPKSLKNYELIEEIAKKLNAEPKIRLFSEYAFEKNGIRFPSRYLITEGYNQKRGARFTRSKTTVTYKDYKFFTVETEVKY
jgi:hypothetical protein